MHLQGGKRIASVMDHDRRAIHVCSTAPMVPCSVQRSTILFAWACALVGLCEACTGSAAFPPARKQKTEDLNLITRPLQI